MRGHGGGSNGSGSTAAAQTAAAQTGPTTERPVRSSPAPAPGPRCSYSRPAACSSRQGRSLSSSAVGPLLGPVTGWSRHGAGRSQRNEPHGPAGRQRPPLTAEPAAHDARRDGTSHRSPLARASLLRPRPPLTRTTSTHESSPGRLAATADLRYRRRRFRHQATLAFTPSPPANLLLSGTPSWLRCWRSRSPSPFRSAPCRPRSAPASPARSPAANASTSAACPRVWVGAVLALDRRRWPVAADRRPTPHRLADRDRTRRRLARLHRHGVGDRGRPAGRGTGQRRWHLPGPRRARPRGRRRGAHPRWRPRRCDVCDRGGRGAGRPAVRGQREAGRTLQAAPRRHARRSPLQRRRAYARGPSSPIGPSPAVPWSSAGATCPETRSATSQPQPRWPAPAYFSPRLWPSPPFPASPRCPTGQSARQRTGCGWWPGARDDRRRTGLPPAGDRHPLRRLLPTIPQPHGRAHHRVRAAGVPRACSATSSSLAVIAAP